MKREHLPAMGGASLFTAFAVLLLTMLALLSLSQARADRRLSETMAEGTREYYAADLEAQKIYARLRSGEIPAQVSREEGFYRYRCSLSRYQTLFVEVDADTLEILRWQVVAHPEAPNEDLSVWTG